MKNIHKEKNAKKFNATIDKVHQEMQHVEKVASDWRVRWDEKFSNAYCYDLQFLLEDEIAWLESLYDGCYDLTDGADSSKRIGAALKRKTLVDDESNEEYVVEFRNIEWILTNSKIGRIFNFNSSGDIKYSQIKRNRKSTDDSYDYYAGFNVNDNSLAIRFVKQNEDLSFRYDGDTRLFQTDGLSLLENTDTIELSVVNDIDHKLVMNFNRLDKMESKVLTVREDTFILFGNELVGASRRIDDDVIDLTIDDRLRERVDAELAKFDIGHLNKKELLTIISNIKTRTINAIKGVSNDVPVNGLAKRLAIALSMISTKQVLEDKPQIKKK